MLADLKYFDGSVQGIERVPDGTEAALQDGVRNRADVDPAMRRGPPEVDRPVAEHEPLAGGERRARTASFMYREAWERGLKTTYYLRTLNKSSIDSANRRPPSGKPAARSERKESAAPSRRCATAAPARPASDPPADQDPGAGRERNDLALRAGSCGVSSTARPCSLSVSRATATTCGFRRGIPDLPPCARHRGGPEGL